MVEIVVVIERVVERWMRKSLTVNRVIEAFEWLLLKFRLLID